MGESAHVSADSAAPQPAAAVVRRAPGRRLWFLAVALAVSATPIVAVWAIPPDNFERGVRVLVTLVSLAVLAGAAAFWFFALGRFSWTTRAVGAVVVLLSVTAALASVRRVEFTGDTVPLVEFRWQMHRDDRLEAHRRDVGSAALEPLDLTVGPHDMAEYRGPRRDGVVSGPALAREWASVAPRTIWRQPVGGGYAAFAVAGDVAITIEQRRDREAIVCYDAATGLERWLYEYPALFSETLGGDGPRATPTIAGGRVYALGATGELCCLEGADGRLVWRVNLFDEAGSTNVVWGMSGSPLVLETLVIVNPGAQQGGAGHAVLALDRESGRRVWASGDAQASYASPQRAVIGGVEQVLVFDAAGLSSYAPATGERLWHVEWTTQFDINAAQPIVLPDERVLITSASGCQLLEVTRDEVVWSPRVVWRNRLLKCSYANPVVRDGFVYGLDDGILACLDLADGQRRWKGGRYGHGQLLLVDDLLLVQCEDGRLVLVEAAPEAHRELASLAALEGRTWNNPVLVEGRAYVRNHLEMACYELPLAGDALVDR